MGHTWDEVPQEIKDTFEKLGIPEAERKILAGVGAQYESEMVYHSLKKEWGRRKGVIFRLHRGAAWRSTPSSSGSTSHDHPHPRQQVRRHELGGLVRGGSFVYIPKNVKLDTPLQATSA